MKGMAAAIGFCSIVFVMFGGAVSSTYGISTAELDGVVNLSVTLEELSKMASEGATALPTNRLVILTGDVESIDVLNSSREGFRAEVNLVDGQWHNLDSISLYRCVVTLSGSDYASQVPSRSGSPTSPATIEPNRQILVVASVTGVRSAPDGSRIPIVRALYVRPIS